MAPALELFVLDFSRPDAGSRISVHSLTEYRARVSGRDERFNAWGDESYEIVDTFTTLLLLEAPGGRPGPAATSSAGSVRADAAIYASR